MIMWKFKSVAPRVWGVSAVAIVALIGLGLVACGGGGSGSAASVSGGGGSAPPAPPVVIPPPACVLGGNPAITPALTASRISGVAPLAVFFDASATTATAAPARPFHDLGFRWNFGESTGPGIAAWGLGAQPTASRNEASGPLAAHVFETPGMYTVCVTITDGTNTVDAAVVITVDDPDLIFAGALTTCISTSGTFTGCPAGAATLTTSNFATAIAAATPGRRLLFRRGETWAAPTAALLTANGPGIIGAFGAGALPKIQSTGNTTMLGLSNGGSPTISDWRIMDLEFDGLGGAGSNAIVGAGGISQVTMLRLQIHDVSNGIQFSASILDFLNGCALPPCPPPPPGGHLMWDQIAVVDANIQRVVGGSGGNGMFLYAQRLALLGNFVEDTTAAEHVVRVQFVDRGVVQANDWGLPALTKTVFTLRAVDVGSGGVAGTGTTQKVVISGNRMRGGDAALPISVQPSAASTDQRIRDIIFDGNLLLAGSAAQTGFISAADEVTVRNNIFNMTAGASGNCMTFDLRGAEPPHSEIRIYNNTCFSNGVAVGRVVTLDATTSNVTIKNNVGYAPNSAPASVFLANLGATGVVGGSGTFGNSSDFQIKNTSPGFLNGSGTFSTANDFRLNGASYALNTGVAVPVFSDIFGGATFNRPQGAAIDQGATEQ
jgi:hypothetical protein